MSSRAARQRRYRERVAEGLAVLRVVVDLVNISETLIASGFLPASAVDDRKAIERALARFLAEAEAADIFE